MKDDEKIIQDMFNLAQGKPVKENPLDEALKKSKIRSVEYQKDMIVADLQYSLTKLDQIIRMEGVDILTDQDVKWLEEVKNQVEVIYELSRRK